MADTSRIRNATRDLAEGLRRFERDWGRLQREIKAAQDAGADEGEILAALNDATAGNPDLANRLHDYIEKLRQALAA